METVVHLVDMRNSNKILVGEVVGKNHLRPRCGSEDNIVTDNKEIEICGPDSSPLAPSRFKESKLKKGEILLSKIKCT